jgi:hypothetical protein
MVRAFSGGFFAALDESGTNAVLQAFMSHCVPT